MVVETTRIVVLLTPNPIRALSTRMASRNNADTTALKPQKPPWIQEEVRPSQELRGRKIMRLGANCNGMVS
jgi:hypothetical protein